MDQAYKIRLTRCLSLLCLEPTPLLFPLKDQNSSYVPLHDPRALEPKPRVRLRKKRDPFLLLPLARVVQG